MAIQKSFADTIPETARVPLNKLYIPVRYQRALEGSQSLSSIEHIQRNFNWAEFGTLLVCKTSPKDEKYGVIDGQHRFRAAELRDDIAEVPCCIISPRPIEEQAKIFLNVNSRRVPLNAFQLHRAALVAQDPIALEIERVCKEADVVIPHYPTLQFKSPPDIFQGANRLRQIVSRDDYEPDALIWGFKCLRAAYPKKHGALRTNLLTALMHWITDYPETTKAQMVKTLQELDLNEMELQARRIRHTDGGSLWKCTMTILRKEMGMEKVKKSA